MKKRRRLVALDKEDIKEFFNNIEKCEKNTRAILFLSVINMFLSGVLILIYASKYL